MSYRWPLKDPDETLDYSVDWSRFLNTATISSITWFVQTDNIGKTALAVEVLAGPYRFHRVAAHIG